MSKQKVVPLTDKTNDQLDAIVKHRQENADFHTVTKKGVVAEYIDKGHKKEIKNKVPPYGYCPTCNSPGISRERRLNGNDKCGNGHTYPSSNAMPF